MHRFYSEEKITGVGQHLFLGKEESLHAARVLRLKESEIVHAFDGTSIWEAKLTNVSQTATELEITSPLPSPEACCKAVLWQGLPKADKMEWIIQKGTELGADAFWIVEMERSVARRDQASRDDKKQERLQKIALEAVKQSGRACIPTVEKPMSFEKALSMAENAFDLILVAWEEEHALSMSGAIKEYLMQNGKPGKILMVIGPEGGISASEYERLKAIGAKAVTLGKRILRTETAGLCALSVLWTVLEEM